MNNDNRNKIKNTNSKSKVTKGIPFKEDEESSSYAQFTVLRKPDKKIKIQRFLFILLYIAFSIGYCLLFLVVTKIPIVIAILPGLLILLWFYTWKRTIIEYTYVSTKNMFYVYRVDGYKNAKEVYKNEISNVQIIVPANDQFAEDFKYYKIDEYFDFSSSTTSDDRYIAIWNINFKNIAIYFNASNKLLSSLKFFGKEKVVVTYVSR